DEAQHLADGPAAGLLERPGGQSLGDGIDVFDAAVCIGTDDRIADRLERHLRPLLLGEYRLLGALALGDVCNRPLVVGNPVGRVPHGARVLENDDLLPIPPAHQKFRAADLPLRFYPANELSPIRRVPVERCNVWQGIQFRRAAVAQYGDEGRIDRAQPPVAIALVYALDDGLEKAAVLRLARPQRLLAEPSGYGDARDLCRVIHDAQLPLAGQARARVIDAERAEHSAVGRLDGRRPGRAQASLERMPARLLPEGVFADVGHQHLAPQIHRGGAGAVADVDGAVLQRRLQLLREPGGDQVGKRLTVCSQHGDGADRADTNRLD